MIVKDENFITEYGDNYIKVTARSTGESSTIKVGERTFMGWVLTSEDLAQMRARATA